MAQEASQGDGRNGKVTIVINKDVGAPGNVLELTSDDAELIKEIYSEEDLREDFDGDFWVSKDLYQVIKDRLGK